MNETAAMIVIYTTFPSEDDARKIGGDLVSQQLAACINIFPGMVSIYRWQDAIETANETAMLVKTRKDSQEKVIEALKMRHPYTVPALIVFEPSHAAPLYLEWLCNQTAPQR